MSEEKVLITGASRGIGLALVKEFLNSGFYVFAACRSPAKAKELSSLADAHTDTMTVLEMDVTSDESVRDAFDKVSTGTDGLDVLVNNAGIKAGELAHTLEEIEFDDFHRSFETNSVGPVRVTRAFLPLLEKSGNARVVNISSGLGAIEKQSGGIPSYVYGVSKAALNFLTKTMGLELVERGITVAALTPGWVRTSMGGQNADLAPEESAQDMVDTIKKLTPQHSGKWFTRNGEHRSSW